MSAAQGIDKRRVLSASDFGPKRRTGFWRATGATHDRAGGDSGRSGCSGIGFGRCHSTACSSHRQWEWLYRGEQYADGDACRCWTHPVPQRSPATTGIHRARQNQFRANARTPSRSYTTRNAPEALRSSDSDASPCCAVSSEHGLRRLKTMNWTSVGMGLAA